MKHLLQVFLTGLMMTLSSVQVCHAQWASLGPAAGITVNVGETKSLTIDYGDGITDHSWSIPLDGVYSHSYPGGLSSSKTIYITGVRKGTSYVRIKLWRGSSLWDDHTCNIYVTEPDPTSITLNSTSVSLVVDETKQLTATVLPEDASQSVTWSVYSGSDVASVSSSGLVTAKTAGTAIIRATSSVKSSVYRDCTVTVTEAPLNPGSWSGNILTIGDNATNSTNNLPYSNYWKYSTVQMLYTPTEIGKSGTINSIAFKVANSASFATSEVKVYLGHKSSKFSGISDYVSSSNLTLVYSGSPTLGQAIGWETLTFNQGSFRYNGTDNLIVVVTKKATSYNTSMKYYCYTGSGYTLYRGSDSTTDYGDVTNTSSYSTSTNRPAIRMVFEVVSPTSISLNTTNVNLAVGGTKQLTATVKPNDASQSVTWSVEEGSDIVSVNSSGLVTANAVGTAKIRATSSVNSSVYKDCTVTVTVPATSLSLNNTSLNLELGETAQLTATVLPNEAYQGVNWSTGYSSVASVSSSGLVTADAVGTATIKATSVTNSSVYSQCTVTVTEPALKPGTWSDDTLTIGDDATGSSYSVPYYNYFKYSTVQTLYTPTEIGKSGTIKSIAFKVANAVSFATTEVNVYLGHKAGTFSGKSDYVSSDDLTLVYSGSPTLGQTLGWETLTFNQGLFTYNGIDNLVVVVTKKSSIYIVSSTNILRYYCNFGTGYTLCRASDGTEDIANVSNTSNSYSTSKYRPAIRMEIEAEDWEDTDISLLENAIYIEPFSARVGDNVQTEICLKNAEAATAYVFELVLPEGITVAKNETGKYMDELSGRHNDHTRTFNYKGNNTYAFSTLSGSSEELTGNDGAIRLVTLYVDESLAEGAYPIQIKNASYSKPNGTLVTMPNTTTSVTVEDYMIGDVNGNGGVDIGDAVSIVNYLVGKETSTFIIKAADTNKNGQIDIGDAVTIVNFLVGKTESLDSVLSVKKRDEIEPQ